MKPTVNRPFETGGGLLIDWLLVNDAWGYGSMIENIHWCKL